MNTSYNIHSVCVKPQLAYIHFSDENRLPVYSETVIARKYTYMYLVTFITWLSKINSVILLRYAYLLIADVVRSHLHTATGMVALCTCNSVGEHILHISNWLTTDWTLNQSLGTPIAGHVVTTGTENGGYFRVHADLTESFVLDVEE